MGGLILCAVSLWQPLRCGQVAALSLIQDSIPIFQTPNSQTAVDRTELCTRMAKEAPAPTEVRGTTYSLEWCFNQQSRITYTGGSPLGDITKLTLLPFLCYCTLCLLWDISSAMLHPQNQPAQPHAINRPSLTVRIWMSVLTKPWETQCAYIGNRSQKSCTDIIRPQYSLGSYGCHRVYIVILHWVTTPLVNTPMRMNSWPTLGSRRDWFSPATA